MRFFLALAEAFFYFIEACNKRIARIGPKGRDQTNTEQDTKPSEAELQASEREARRRQAAEREARRRQAAEREARRRQAAEREARRRQAAEREAQRRAFRNGVVYVAGIVVRAVELTAVVDTPALACGMAAYNLAAAATVAIETKAGVVAASLSVVGTALAPLAIGVGTFLVTKRLLGTLFGRFERNPLFLHAFL